jgi:nicotinamide-nucleotide amidase
LRALWQERGRGEIPLTNRTQIMIPRGATVLTNRHGSAPGIWLEDDRGTVVCDAAGVPREMRGMLATSCSRASRHVSMASLASSCDLVR